MLTLSIFYVDIMFPSNAPFFFIIFRFDCLEGILCDKIQLTVQLKDFICLYSDMYRLD